MKKIVSISLVFMFTLLTMLPTTSFATISTYSNIDREFNKISEHVYSAIPTEEEKESFIKKHNLPEPTKIDKSYEGNIIEDYKLTKISEYTDKNGNKVESRYYSVNFKDNKYANQVKKHIEKNQSKEANLSDDFGIMYIPDEPQEGDVKIKLISEHTYETTGIPFDTQEGPKETLEEVRFKKNLSLISDTFPSNFVIDLMKGQILDNIINGDTGTGKAVETTRVVTKQGQVYTNGNWKTLFETNSREYYWVNEMESYDPYTLTQEDDVAYYEPTGTAPYNPINWIDNVHFYDDNYILETTYSRYEAGADSIAYDYLGTEYWSEVWNTPFDRSYWQ